MIAHNSRKWTKAVLLGVGLAALGSTGCQTHIGGQTLPSPYYLTDDVQYFAPDSENKLAREAASMKALDSDDAALGN